MSGAGVTSVVPGDRRLRDDGHPTDGEQNSLAANGSGA